MTPLATALDEVVKSLTRFIHFDHDAEVDMLALVGGATYAVGSWQIVPYPHITSAGPDSGKTTLCKLLRRISYRGVLVGGGGSAAYVLRRSHEVTLIVDEVDNLWKVSDTTEWKAMLAQILNCGFDREAAYVGRAEGSNPKNMRAVEIPCFGFKVISGIGDLPPVVATRCLEVSLRRALPGEVTERYRPTRAQREKVDAVAARLAEAVEALGDLEDREPNPEEIPVGLVNRAADLWHPLLVIADCAGGNWPSRARQAAARWLGQRDTGAAAAIVRDLNRLLTDKTSPLSTFNDAEGKPRVASTDLVDRLVGLDDSVWSGDDRGRKPLTTTRLAALLRPYKVWPSEKTRPRSYLRAALRDVAARNMPAARQDEGDVDDAVGEAPPPTPPGSTRQHGKSGVRTPKTPDSNTVNRGSIYRVENDGFPHQDKGFTDLPGWGGGDRQKGVSDAAGDTGEDVARCFVCGTVHDDEMPCALPELQPVDTERSTVPDEDPEAPF